MAAGRVSSCPIRAAPGPEWRHFLRSLPSRLTSSAAAPPKAILLVSGHWQTDGFAFTGAAKPPLIYDYYGFPPADLCDQI